MSAAKDFVMPKLGLTMTEGAVARWVIAAGHRFEAGDVVAVIETDKIAYDFEAPSAGVLQETLVSEGHAVPVGTPIGRWDIGDADVNARPAVAEPPTQHADVAAPMVLPQAVGSGEDIAPLGVDRRILATPYARRLARIANIDLRNVTGSGPRGRIKAADVNRSASAPTPPARSPESTAYSPVPTPNVSRPMRLFSAGVEADVGRLLALNAQIIRELPPLQPRLVHFVILAASRVLGAASREFVIGLAENADPPSSPLTFASKDCASLRPIVEHADGQMSAAATAPGGTLWLVQAEERLSFISSEPPPGWLVSLGVGSPHAIFRPDADGRPIATSTVSLVVACRAGEFDPARARAVLSRIRDLLENPTYLLIS